MPVSVQGLASGVQAVAVGTFFTCALVNGGVQCWGDNSNGQLGNGTTTNSSVPVEVEGLTSGVQASWRPVQVQGLSSGVQAIATGYVHTCALVNGGVRCWGSNYYGELGNGSTTYPDANVGIAVPVEVVGLASGVQAIAAGEYHTCAVVNGGVQCWGRNVSGQLGNNSTGESHVPVAVVGLLP